MVCVSERMMRGAVCDAADKPPPAVGAGSPQSFGPSSVVYCGWDQHLYEYNFDTGSVLDHSTAFGVSVPCFHHKH
jgi:hypothetical protein